MASVGVPDPALAVSEALSRHVAAERKRDRGPVAESVATNRALIDESAIVPTAVKRRLRRLTWGPVSTARVAACTEERALHWRVSGST
jgi:hypothetical protein